LEYKVFYRTIKLVIAICAFCICSQLQATAFISFPSSTGYKISKTYKAHYKQNINKGQSVSFFSKRKIKVKGVKVLVVHLPLLDFRQAILPVLNTRIVSKQFFFETNFRRYNKGPPASFTFC
jgi:hypothetical protein